MKMPAVAVLLAVATAGCASKADVETMGDALRADIASIDEGQRLLLAQFRGGLDSLEAADMRRENTGRGEFERRVGRLESLFSELMDIVTQNNQLLNDLYQNQVAGRTSPAGRPPQGGNDRLLGTGAPAQFYGMALDQYNQGNLATARDAFHNFLSENGDHELAPDAQYYIARTYEDEDDPGNALEEYRRVTEQWPDSNRAPAALYRRGMIEAGRGNTANARRLFAQVESGYPNSPEAPLARQELQKLGG